MARLSLLVAIALGWALPASPGFPETPAPAKTETPLCFEAETSRVPDEDTIASCTAVIRRASGGPQLLSSALRNRATAYHRMGQYEQAVDDLDHAIGLDPENEAAWRERCFDNALLRRVEEALVDCRKALAFAPEDADAWEKLGFARLIQGKDAAALGAYDRALALAPELPQALFGRGIVELRNDDQKGGDADIADSKALLPDIADIFARFGISSAGAAATPAATQ